MSRPPQSSTGIPPRWRVVVAGLSFLAGFLIAVPALLRSDSPRGASPTTSRTVQTPTVAPTATITSAPTPGPTPGATVTVTQIPPVTVVLPSTLSVRVDDGEDKDSAIWAAIGSFMAGAGSLGLLIPAFAALRRRPSAPENDA